MGALQHSKGKHTGAVWLCVCCLCTVCVVCTACVLLVSVCTASVYCMGVHVEYQLQRQQPSHARCVHAFFAFWFSNGRPSTYVSLLKQSLMFSSSIFQNDACRPSPPSSRAFPTPLPSSQPRAHQNPTHPWLARPLPSTAISAVCLQDSSHHYHMLASLCWLPATLHRNCYVYVFLPCLLPVLSLGRTVTTKFVAILIFLLMWALSTLVYGACTAI